MNISPTEVSVVAASAVCGCLATAVAFNAVTGKPVFVIAGNWRKYLWSVIFALPALFIFDLDVPLALTLLFLVGWLIVAPSVAAKFVFGSKDAAWSFLFMLHSAYAFSTLAGILLLNKALGIG